MSETSLLIDVLHSHSRWMVQTTFNTPCVDLGAGMAPVRAGMSNGRFIAFNYDLEYAGRMVGLLTAYDETLPRRC